MRCPEWKDNTSISALWEYRFDTACRGDLGPNVRKHRRLSQDSSQGAHARIASAWERKNCGKAGQDRRGADRSCHPSGFPRRRRRYLHSQAASKPDIVVSRPSWLRRRRRRGEILIFRGDLVRIGGTGVRGISRSFLVSCASLPLQRRSECALTAYLLAPSRYLRLSGGQAGRFQGPSGQTIYSICSPCKERSLFK